MKKTFYIWFFISIFFTFGLVNCSSRLEENPTALRFNANRNQPVEISINTNRSSSIEKGAFGFNTNLFEASYNYLDSDFLENTDILKPQSLRFPGGTVANFYHWKTGGFVEQELSS